MAKKWTEESAKIAADLYTAKLEADGKEAAANNDFLDSIAKEVEAVSGKAVRSKLTVMGIYQKPDAVASVAKTNTVRKEHYVRALAHTLGLDADQLDSLKNGKTDALQAVTDKLGVTNVIEAAAKGYSPRPEMVVMLLAQNLGLDFDDLDTYNQELTEAAAVEADSE